MTADDLAFHCWDKDIPRVEIEKLLKGRGLSFVADFWKEYDDRVWWDCFGPDFRGWED